MRAAVGLEDFIALGSTNGVQREDLRPSPPAAQDMGRLADLALAGEEDQDVARAAAPRLVHRPQERLGRSMSSSSGSSLDKGR